MISPTPATVDHIFSAPHIYQIPRYQRPYSWKKSHAEELWEDLSSSMKKPGAGALFLGTLIFENSNKEILKVVDGQQRLTTIEILFIAIREKLKELNEMEIATNVQTNIAFQKKSSGKTTGPRLLASTSISDAFAHLCDYHWDGIFPKVIDGKQVRRQSKKLEPVYGYFWDQIKEFDQPNLSKLIDALFEAYFIRIELRSEEEAFDIFERTNARGAELEASDLLKNYLFSQGVENLEDKWESIIENSEGAILKMFKYFYVSRRGYISKSELYKSIKAYASVVGGPDFLVNELVDFSSYFSAIRQAGQDELRDYLSTLNCSELVGVQYKYDRVYLALQGLRLFGITQHYPLIYAALHCYKKDPSGKATDSLVKLFEALEKYHFINNAICERVGNEIEMLYANTSNDFAQRDDFMKCTNEFLVSLNGKIAGREEFIGRFKDISYSGESIPLISYIFDRITNISRQPGARTLIYNPDLKLLRRNHSIEHFLPQKPKSQPDEATLEAIHNIGNLLIVEYHANSSLGNDTPEEKMKRLVEGDLRDKIGGLPHIQDFITRYKAKATKWDAQAISDRAKDLATTAYDTVWKI